MKQKIIFSIMFLLLGYSLFSYASAESGRDSAMDLVDSSSYVSSSYIDLDSILDDYTYPYIIDTNESITFNIAASYESYMEIGGPLSVQVSFKTNEYEYFKDVDFNYIIYINNIELIEDKAYLNSIKASLIELLNKKSSSSNILVYLKKDNKAINIKSKTDITNLIKVLPAQTNKNITDSFREAKKDLENLIKSVSDNNLPNKFFWVFDKPIAKSQKDINDIFSIIAGLGNYNTEVSFCGNSENFRAGTVKKIVDQFGGNSYYFEDPNDLKDTLTEDYNFYRRPAISDLKIEIYDLSDNPRIIKDIKINSMGSGEHHTYLSTVNIPYKKYVNSNTKIYKGTLVKIEYFDRKAAKKRYYSEYVEIEYTDELNSQYNTEDKWVIRNRTIQDTYNLVIGVSNDLRNNWYSNALLKLENQIEVLEKLNTSHQDKLIEEDIELLRKYKKLIYENKDNPLNAFKTFSELSRKKY